MFFFFKQKTAYEMRISDWSSDVCSSDLSASIAYDTARGLEIRFDMKTPAGGCAQECAVGRTRCAPMLSRGTGRAAPARRSVAIRPCRALPAACSTVWKWRRATARGGEERRVGKGGGGGWGDWGGEEHK